MESRGAIDLKVCNQIKDDGIMSEKLATNYLNRLTEDNYDHKIFRFRDRQAGISVIYDGIKDLYTYNAYCLETKILKELFSVEFDFLVDALELINDEFGTWELVDMVPQKQSGCGSCAAK